MSVPGDVGFLSSKPHASRGTELTPPQPHPPPPAPPCRQLHARPGVVQPHALCRPHVRPRSHHSVARCRVCQTLSRRRFQGLAISTLREVWTCCNFFHQRIFRGEPSTLGVLFGTHT